MALKEKHHIPKSEYAIRSKVALMPVFIQVMELVFLSRGREFLSKIPKSIAIREHISAALIFLPQVPMSVAISGIHFFIKKKVEEEISRVVTKKFNET